MKTYKIEFTAHFSNKESHTIQVQANSQEEAKEWFYKRRGDSFRREIINELSHPEEDLDEIEMNTCLEAEKA